MSRALIQIQWAEPTSQDKAEGKLYPETYLLPSFVQERGYFGTIDWLSIRFGHDIIDFTIVSYQ